MFFIYLKYILIISIIRNEVFIRTSENQSHYEIKGFNIK